MTDSGQRDGSDETAPGISRRRVLTGAGLAVAGGAGMAAGVAAPAQAADPSVVSTAATGTVAVEFRGRIEQSGSAGESFVSYGYLTRVAGLKVHDLFRGTPSTSTALFTAYATGHLVTRLLDQSVHALDIVGSLTVHQRTSPGADFASPGSFAIGRRVATYNLRLQDVLAVFAPARGLPTLTGDMHQTRARHLHAPLAGRTFGADGRRLRMFATGLGTLTDPVTLNALLEIAGTWTVV